MIQDKKITIPAGSEVPVQGVGTFVGVLDVSDTTQELRVSAINSEGQQVLSARMLQGERVTLDKRFNQLRIKNEGVATVEVLLLVGSGKFESGRLTGSVAVENAVEVMKAAPEDPFTLDGFESVFVNSNNGTLKTIVSPAENVAGIWVHKAASINAKSRIMFKGTAPVDANDSGAFTLGLSRTSSGEAASWVGVENVLIPAGNGLYVYPLTTTYVTMAMINYKVL